MQEPFRGQGSGTVGADRGSRHLPRFEGLPGLLRFNPDLARGGFCIVARDHKAKFERTLERRCSVTLIHLWRNLGPALDVLQHKNGRQLAA